MIHRLISCLSHPYFFLSCLALPFPSIKFEKVSEGSASFPPPQTECVEHSRKKIKKITYKTYETPISTSDRIPSHFLFSCVYGDYVKLFLHLDDSSGPVVNDDTPYNDVLCGKIADIEQTHYSSGSSLVFEFHSDWRSGNNTGFRGTYRFLSRSEYLFRLFESSASVLECTLDINCFKGLSMCVFGYL